jgi:hypothetical protein
MKLFGRFGDRSATATDESPIDRLIRENGWTPDVRHGHAFALAFKGDAITPSRDVYIAHTPGNAIATFSCGCRARFLASSMSPVQLALFLARNKQSLFGKWQITVEDGEVSAKVFYPALAAGLTAPVFKAICGSLLSEVAFVEESMLGGASCDDVPVPSPEPV